MDWLLEEVRVRLFPCWAQKQAREMVVIANPVQSIYEKDGLEDNQQRVPEAWNHGFPAGYFLI